MKEIQTNGITILLVEVPEDVKLWSIDNDNELYLYVSVSDDTPDIIGLGKGQYQILGKSTELSEEQMKEICELLAEFGLNGEAKLYMNYKYNKPVPCTFTCGTVEESYLSLLEANGIVDRNPYNKPSDLPYTYDGYEEFYNESQSKVKHYLVLKRI